MGTILVNMTYSTITPESAADGDTADHGFYESGGWRYSIADDAFWDRVALVGREQALAAMEPEPLAFESVEDVVSFLVAEGATFQGGDWATGEVIQDRAHFELGEDTTISYHLTCSDSDFAAVLLLRALSY